VVTRTWGDDRTETVDGVHVHRVQLPEPSWRKGTVKLTTWLAATRERAVWNRVVQRRMREIHRRHPIDVIEAPEYGAQAVAVALRLPRVPLTVRLHSPSFLCRELNGVAVGGSRLDTMITELAE